MTDETDLPKDLLESVREAVGRSIKLSLRKMVKLEVKADKLENRVLVLASHRAYLLTTRIPCKIEHSFNYLDIQGVTSTKPSQVILEHERGQWCLRLGGVDEVDEVVGLIGGCLHRICPGVSPAKVMKKLSLVPPERTAALQAVWEEQEASDLGPCGGFSHMYWCLCDQMGLPYREEVQWDVDTIYLTQDSRELNLQDFTHLENRDLVAIIAVLEINQWFTKLSTKDYRLPTDVCEQILRVVARSARLEELVLENAGLKSDFGQKLASALCHNPASSLNTLNLTSNSLEDKGVSALSAQLAKLPMGLKHLNLSRNSMSPKGANCLALALCANPVVPTTLKHLDLSGNSLRGDDLPNLYSFLSQQNCLVTLDLSCSDCSLDQVCASLLKGSLKHLSVLNMSKSVFSHRRSKDIPPSFKQFFSSALSLSTVNMSGTRLPLEALKALLLGMGCNPNLSDVSLDLSCCELRSGGSQILEGCIAEIPNISSLDISDNGLDSDMTTLLVWLAKNRSIRHLALGKNFNNIKSKNLSQVLENLVHMIQEEESPLTSLSLADSRLKADLTIVLNALGSNSSLTKLDISGNAMGDMGAKMLAKALQINTKLRTMIWDKNNISPQGLQDVASALEKNYTIRFMPMPIIDAAQALKASPDKTEDALLKMEQYLLRNHETRKYLQEQAYRLQQGIVTSTTQQMMDRMCVKVQDHLNSLRFSESDTVQEDMRAAGNLMKDARNSKTLLPKLYHQRGPPGGAVGGEEAYVGPVQDQLQAMAGELARVMDEQLQILLRSMVETAEGLCPHVLKRSSLRQDLVREGSGRMAVPRSFITNTLLEQAGVDIVNKISEVKLSMASVLSDRIVDEILESLSASQHTLAGHLMRKTQPLMHHGPQETVVLDETVLQPEARNQAPRPAQNQAPNQAHAKVQSQAQIQEEMDTCLMTPKSKRKSIMCRMLRPVSVAFEMEFDLDKALEEVPIHVEDPPPPTPLEEEQGYFGELPTVEVCRLEHHTKTRPKPQKRSKPSRTTTDSSSAALEVEDSCIMAKVDEGVDEFFYKKVTKLSFKRSSLRSSTHSQEGAEKKRESRKSGFLNLIKSCSPRSEKSQGAAAISAPPQPAAAVATATEEPMSPKVQLSTEFPIPPPAEPGETSPDRSRECSTPDPPKEDQSHPHQGEGKAGHHAGRHFGVPVMGGMGMDLLAEMKAKMAAHKSDSPLSKTDGKPAKPDSQRGGQDPDPNPRSRLHPVPPQGSKPPLAHLNSGPLSPRISSSHSLDGSPEFPVGNSSPKAPLPAPRLKRAPSDQERECSSSGAAGLPSPVAAVELTIESYPVDAAFGPDTPTVAERPWSSLKRSAQLSHDQEVDRGRTKSLPASARVVRPPSMLEPSSPPGPEGEEAASDPQEESPGLGTKQDMGPGDSEGQASDEAVPL
ncbi:F-actin-uncapping protein LRRC16A-like [Osmerus eperlanus]|uniref:F-actin-uncapping protein LRRC16A-like n=1 Tax=Osmerus eperlanus TaxID=29151 RepID=UPI002E13F47C